MDTLYTYRSILLVDSPLADPGLQRRGGQISEKIFQRPFFRSFPKNFSIYFPTKIPSISSKFLMTFFLVIDLFCVLYMVFFHRGAKSAADIDRGGPNSLLFNKITILPLLFLSRRGVPNLHSQFRGGGPMAGFAPPGSAT